MVDSDEIINFQIALAKKIIQKTGNGELPVQFQLAIYEQCNKDLRMKSKLNNNTEIRAATFRTKHN